MQLPHHWRGRSGALLRAMGWVLMLALALFLAVVSLPYLLLNPDVYLEQQRLVYLNHQAMITLHVAASIVALALGPFQFLPSLRRRRRAAHRWLGRLYLGGVLLGGLSGFYMAFLAYGGPMGQLGFGLLAVLWLGSGGMAYRAIRRGAIQQHRAWMLRNYALTFVAVTFRLWLMLLIAALDMAFAPAYAMAIWLAVTLNPLAVEIVLATRHRTQQARLTPRVSEG